MKKLWVTLLAVLLLAALAMTCASAEADEEIILGTDWRWRRLRKKPKKKGSS